MTGLVVYFVQSGTDGPIKIGSSEDLASRLSTLQTGCAEPIRLLGAVRVSDPVVERRLHRHLSEHRLRGEWFAPHPDVFAALERLSGGLDEKFRLLAEIAA